MIFRLTQDVLHIASHIYVRLILTSQVSKTHFDIRLTIVFLGLTYQLCLQTILIYVETIDI
jgi:hypothetical protein